jgi:hypothetical protein
MMSPQTLLGYLKAEPFRPFRFPRANGRTLDVRHPEKIKVLKVCALVFTMLTPKFLSQLEASVS